MRVWNILFVPNNNLKLESTWPWWEKKILGQPLRRIVIKAENKREAMKKFYACHGITNHNNYEYIHIISCTEKEPDFDPFNEEYKREEWMKWE